MNIHMGLAHRRKGKPKTFAGVVFYGKKQIYSCKHPHQSRESAANCATEKAGDLDREASRRELPDSCDADSTEPKCMPEVHYPTYGIGS